jgi:histidine triad (HIT) family protein
MADCIFCKIASKELPSENIVYENGHSVAFLDIRPVNPGHTLVVPKEHHADLFETPEAVLTDMIAAAKKVAAAVKKALKADGVNLGMNNGTAAGQVIFHAHMHVIPRFTGDGLRHWPNKDVTPDDLRTVAEKVRKQLH